MKLLKNKGKFKVLSKPKNIIHDIASAARTCYQSFKNQNKKSDEKLVKVLLERGHHAMLEMADLKVKFSNVSRGFTHEMVRHRLASFSQESTRYVDEKGFDIVYPPHQNDIETYEEMTMHGDRLDLVYRDLRKKGWRPEDARQFLPIGLANEIVVKANIREWRHIFTMRCDHYAHWEIRELMLRLLIWCKDYIPLVFDDFHLFCHSEKKIMYARPVMSEKVLKEHLFHSIDSGRIDSQILIEYINSIRKETI